MILNQNFQWIFFLSSDSKEDAYVKGNWLLIYLEDIYKGLSGTLSVREYDPSIYSQNYWLIELKYPNKLWGGSEYDRLRILKHIITLFHKNRGHKIHFFILWQEHPMIIKNHNFRIFLFTSISTETNKMMFRGFEKELKKGIVTG